MRKERVVVSALGRWESAKKKTREETIVERARVSRRVGGDTTSLCTQNRLPQSLCSQEERAPNEKEKMASESSAWGRLRPNARRPPPHRSLRRTTTLPEIVSAFRDRGRIDPHQSHLSKAPDFFFFRSRHHERKRPNKTNLRAANRPRRFATGARTSETGGPRPFASLLFFAPQKNVPFFSSSSSAAATLWRLERVLCGAPNACVFGGRRGKERRCS